MARDRKRATASAHRVLTGCLVGFAMLAAALIVYAELAHPRGPTALGIGGPFALIDQDGRAVTDATYRGKWLLVYFGYTYCPDACPTALNDMAAALDDLGPRRAHVQPLLITIDPERDTPAVLKDYTAAFQAGIVGLTGSAAQIAQAAKAYGVYYKREGGTGRDYLMAHSSVIYLMDPAGHFVANFSHETPPETIAAKLREVVS